MARQFGKKAADKAATTTAPDLLRGAPPKLTLDTLACVIGQGAAVMIGGTRDGSALVITLLDGDTRDKVYCHDKDELRAALTDLAADFAGERPF